MTALDGDWRHVYRWDLDKTYLDTHFEKFSRMVRIAFESADEKKNIPGSAALLREISREQPGISPARVCIVSGSPRQMRPVLEKKLRSDGILWHEFELKPQLKNIRRGRFKAIRDQVGYKLPLLLASRAGLAPGIPETLFGDDAEADTYIYCLYADLVAGRVTASRLVEILRSMSTYSDAIEACLDAVARIQPSDAVERVFIHLDKRTPPEWFAPFGDLVVPVFNYFQAALVLYTEGHMEADGVLRVTRAFLEADEYPPEELANYFQDIQRRGHLPAGAMKKLGQLVRAADEGSVEAAAVTLCEERYLQLGPAASSRDPRAGQLRDWVTLTQHQRRRRH